VFIGDHLPRRKAVLAGGYTVALGMALLLATGEPRLGVLIVVFALAGIFTGIVETLEDSITAEIVPPTQHGMAYGTLAAVNALGDFTSSVVVGAIWTAVSPSAAFAAAGVLFAAATVLILRLRER
jgi:MFS family permease